MKLRLFQWLMLSSLLAACASATVFPMSHSPATPAAEGSVMARAGENGNTRIFIEVRHLARPEEVSPAAKVYVVWVQPPQGPPQNIGALRVDENLTGSLDTVTPFPSFGLFITAEGFPATTVPQGPKVLEAAVSQ